MVLSDNTTHWNSTYLMLHRVLKLRPQITTICAMNINDLKKDTFFIKEWNEIKEIEIILTPFYKVIKRLEDNAVESHHDSIWEALSTVELLLQHLERLKEIYRNNSYLVTNVNLA